ncbi:hypothetical protein G6F32_014949 [Rhizopus arrhizus]|nr:hypothetical protein G6F32_014949 [Rhizopus arrhizus]
MKASHTFNLLDARRAISVTERQRYILRVRALAQAVAKAYYEQREKLGFPGAKKACPPLSPLLRGAGRDGNDEPTVPPADRTGHRGAAGQGAAGPGPGLLRWRCRRPAQARRRAGAGRCTPVVDPAPVGRAAAGRWPGTAGTAQRSAGPVPEHRAGRRRPADQGPAGLRRQGRDRLDRAGEDHRQQG